MRRAWNVHNKLLYWPINHRVNPGRPAPPNHAATSPLLCGAAGCDAGVSSAVFFFALFCCTADSFRLFLSSCVAVLLANLRLSGEDCEARSRWLSWRSGGGDDAGFSDKLAITLGRRPGCCWAKLTLLARLASFAAKVCARAVAERSRMAAAASASAASACSRRVSTGARKLLACFPGAGVLGACRSVSWLTDEAAAAAAAA